MKWTTIVQMGATVTRKDLTLVLTVGAIGKRQWGVIALEVPTSAGLKRSARAKIDASLDAHSHVQLDPQPTMTAALRLAERYAKWWRGTRAVSFKCDCKTIA